MPPRKIKVVDVINDIEDVPQHTEVEVKATENTDTIDEEQPAIENDTQLPLGYEPETNENPPTNIKTVEMVECPDCNKKMTKKTLKYSHAKNCLANKQQKEETKEEETQPELLGHDDEQPPSPPPILKRTVSVKPEKNHIQLNKLLTK